MMANGTEDCGRLHEFGSFRGLERRDFSKITAPAALPAIAPIHYKAAAGGRRTVAIDYASLPSVIVPRSHSFGKTYQFSIQAVPAVVRSAA